MKYLTALLASILIVLAVFGVKHLFIDDALALNLPWSNTRYYEYEGCIKGLADYRLCTMKIVHFNQTLQYNNPIEKAASRQRSAFTSKENRHRYNCKVETLHKVPPPYATNNLYNFAQQLENSFKCLLTADRTLKIVIEKDNGVVWFYDDEDAYKRQCQIKNTNNFTCKGGFSMLDGTPEDLEKYRPLNGESFSNIPASNQ